MCLIKGDLIMLLRILMIISFSLIYHSVNAEGISLNQSRIIFSANDNSQQAQIRNTNNEPLLIQSTIIKEIEGNSVNNFMVTPPLFRMEPNSEFSLRIVPNKIDDLPKEKESLFYLKIRAIPSIKEAEDSKEKPGMVFITAFIIKLYYRPEKIEPPNDETYQLVELKGKNGNWYFNNPTPYYMTMVDLSIDGKAHSGSLLIPPFSQYPFTEINKNTKNISWRFLNDLGVGTKIFLLNLNEKNNFNK